jgi:tRNA (cytidine/uridine-2'-O-)-methyltransferase
MKPHLALFEPDIPQNVGAAMRLAACMGMPLDIIEPCTFVWDDAKIRRSGMDYIDHVEIIKHVSWDAFASHYQDRRIVLLTTKADQSYLDFTYQNDDILLAGRASDGVPQSVHDSATHRITIPMAPAMRSMNVINACAMVVGEVLRQTR